MCINKFRLSFTLLFLIWGSASIAHASSLSLSSAVVNPGGTATLGVALTVSGTAPAALEWTFTYSPSQISGISITSGPAATAAVKTLSCASAPGVAACVLSGLNANQFGPGAVAYLNATVAPGTTAVSIQISNLDGADSGGNGLSVTSAGGGAIAVPTLSPVACSPTAVSAGATSTCTVTLTQTAPTGGSIVTLVSNNSALAVPASVTVAAGATTATFNATAAASITSNQSATVTATLGSSSQTATISLLAPVLVSGLVCSPTSLGQSAASTCTLTLAQTAPTGGSSVTLASNNASLTVPASVTVAAGATTTTFGVTAVASITSNQSATVTATLGGSSKTATISLLAPVLVSGVACAPTSLGQSAVSRCTVTLTQSAPTGGSSVTLASNNASLTVPASVAVASGAATATFSATAAAMIASNQTATVTATLGSSSQTATISLLASVIVSGVACNPTSLARDTSSTCKVTLALTAPAGGSSVTLASNNSSLTVPASVSVSAGAATSSFKAEAGSSRSRQTATITASLNGSVASTSVTLTGSVRTRSVSGTPASQPSGNAVSSLVCSPNAVTAGGVVTCELLVTASTQAVPVVLSSSSEQVLLPALVTTRPNQSSLTFQAQSIPDSKQQPVTITATLGTSEIEDTILLMAPSGPVLRVPERQVARLGTPISFAVSALDPSSGLPVKVESATSPAGASFDPTTGVFEWTPQASQAGKYRIMFTATNSARQSSTAQVELEADSGLPALNSPTSSCSPGGIATITGKWLATPGLRLLDRTGASLDLGGTSVAVNGQAIPVLYSSADRVDFLCPATKAGTGTQLAVEVTSPFGSSQPVTFGMVEGAPTILSMDDSPQNQGLISFSGMNDLVMERNFSVSAHPAQPGDEIVILATGLGSAAEASSGTMLVKVSDVYAGVKSVQAVPGYAGVYAIHVTVPAAMTFGTVPVGLQMMAPDGHQLNSNYVTATFEAIRY